MHIFNITDECKEFFKEYIKTKDKETQWVVYRNIMVIFNITPLAQETFIKYISEQNNELKEENKELKDKITKKSKDKKNKPSVQHYEYLNVHPKNIKPSREYYVTVSLEVYNNEYGVVRK